MVQDHEFKLQATKNISILLPTRGRGELAFSSLQSLVTHADQPEKIEFLIALDNDDQESQQYFVENILPWFDEKNLDLTVYTTPRYGYVGLHNYNNFLAARCSGNWVVFWNDDAVMQSNGWDTEILKHNGRFELLAFDTHHAHPYSIFPILPRDWLILFEKLSDHQQNDAWVSQIAYMADCLKRIPITVLHDRADLTGNNKDKTYAEREYREGNLADPLDINHPAVHARKIHWATKVVWLRKLIGQDTGWFDKAMRGEVDMWQKMKDNDINNQVMVVDTKSGMTKYGPQAENN